jgi:hypothetical protein
VSRIEKEARDVGREQTEQLQKLRSAYEEYDAVFRSFRAAILRSDAAEKVNKRIPACGTANWLTRSR